MKVNFQFFILIPAIWMYSCKQSPDAHKRKTEEHIQHESIHQIIDIKDTNIQQFIPKDERVIFQAKGDITQDGIEDIILVLGKNKEANTSDFINGNPSKRQLLILTGMKEGGLENKFQSDKAVECIDCSGYIEDAFKSIEINKDGTFTIHHEIMKEQYWKESRTFKYDPTLKNWFLTKDHFTSFRDDVGEGNPKDLKLGHEIKETAQQFGKISLNDFDIYAKNRR